MCGIVGAISTQKKPELSKIVESMNNQQIHRGPDGQGLWSSVNGMVHLGHRRLSIIDLSTAGAQPMLSLDKNFIITFNGEIYNYIELKEKCIKLGSTFQSNSDTEVIIEYYKHFGAEGIKDLRGMWAFALYDIQKNEIILSRDPFGIKPLHYGFVDGVLYFASEIKSLKVVDDALSIPDEDTIKLFEEYGYLDIGDWTFYKNIKRFPQACYAKIDLGNPVCEISPVKYWEPSIKPVEISEADAIAKLDSLLQQSIKRHMRADVPIAFCLSGGLDSSLIVSMSSKLSSNSNLNTFTTHFPDHPEIDETKWAKMAIDETSANATWVQPSTEDFINDFDDVIFQHDEPFGSTSIYAQNAIYKAISQKGLKVSLDGQGADELFAGYHSYFLFYVLSLVHQKKYGTSLREVAWIIFRQPSLLRQLLSISILGKIAEKCRNLLSSKKTNEPVNPTEISKRLAFIRGLQTPDFSQHLLNTLLFSSIPQLLRNGDRNSMRHSVESRVPFLDVDLVDFVLSLPDNYKIRNAVTK
ncbi:MAG: asparagine synthase (glutamine-hydrolyzing), partial [Alphaproteobacteria bacterium]